MAVEFNDQLMDKLVSLCKRRGFILRGGEFDYERGAKALIDDFRKGRVGKICLEKPSDYTDFEF
jgi:ribosome biogenesis GTPase A